MEGLSETRVTPRRAIPEGTWQAFSRWQDGLLFSQSVATPARLLWRHYREFCAKWGFPVARPGTFMRWVSEMEGARLTQAGPHDENVVSGVVIGE